MAVDIRHSEIGVDFSRQDPHTHTESLIAPPSESDIRDQILEREPEKAKPKEPTPLWGNEAEQAANMIDDLIQELGKLSTTLRSGSVITREKLDETMGQTRAGMLSVGSHYNSMMLPYIYAEQKKARTDKNP